MTISLGRYGATAHTMVGAERQTSGVVPLPSRPHMAEAARTPQPPAAHGPGPDERASQTVPGRLRASPGTRRAVGAGFAGIWAQGRDPSPTPATRSSARGSARIAGEHASAGVGGRRNGVHSLPGSGHAVADAALAEDVPGAGRVVAELAPEVPHEDAHPVRACALASRPHSIEQRLVGHDPSGIEREHARQLVLGGGERDRVSVHRPPGVGRRRRAPRGSELVEAGSGEGPASRQFADSGSNGFCGRHGSRPLCPKTPGQFGLTSSDGAGPDRRLGARRGRRAPASPARMDETARAAMALSSGRGVRALSGRNTAMSRETRARAFGRAGEPIRPCRPERARASRRRPRPRRRIGAPDREGSGAGSSLEARTGRASARSPANPVCFRSCGAIHAFGARCGSRRSAAWAPYRDLALTLCTTVQYPLHSLYIGGCARAIATCGAARGLCAARLAFGRASPHRDTAGAAMMRARATRGAGADRW